MLKAMNFKFGRNIRRLNQSKLRTSNFVCTFRGSLGTKVH